MPFSTIELPSKTPNIHAIETAVVDLNYDEKGGNDLLKRDFFKNLPSLLDKAGIERPLAEAPRGGDMIMADVEYLDKALVFFGQNHALISSAQNSQHKSAEYYKEQAKVVLRHIFGEAVAHAGGSEANTFDGLIHSRINGQSVCTGQFATVVGDDEFADAFEKPFEGHFTGKRKGRTMVSHIVPIDGDRIMLTTPGGRFAAENNLTASVVCKKGRLAKADRIMLGGYLRFTPHWHDIYGKVLQHIQQTPDDKNKASLVMTAAAQAVADDLEFQKTFLHASTIADLTIHANTGEFRRLLGMDKEWREPTLADFADVQGQALEARKKDHDVYQGHKKDANQAAIQYAVSMCRNRKKDQKKKLRFVVTNGAKEVFVVTAQGCETYIPEKLSRDKIVNTVGAGDNQMAGFQLGDMTGLSHEESVKLGNRFARAIIQSPRARLDRNAEHTENGVTYKGPLAHALKG